MEKIFNMFRKKQKSITQEEQKELDRRADCFKCKYCTEINWFCYECTKFNIDLTNLSECTSTICDHFEWDKDRKNAILKEFEQQKLYKKINFRYKEEYL